PTSPTALRRPLPTGALSRRRRWPAPELPRQLPAGRPELRLASTSSSPRRPPSKIRTCVAHHSYPSACLLNSFLSQLSHGDVSKAGIQITTIGQSFQHHA